jgi:hypothetical protein
MRDPKNAFYRTIHLDKESQDVLKWYRKIVKQIKNDSELKQYEKNNEQSNKEKLND